MSNHQTVIVYRNPVEAEMWEFWGPYIPYLAMGAIFLIVGFLLVYWIFSMINKSARNKRYNSSHYDSAEYNTLADL